MATRIYDPAILNAQGALVDLNQIAKQQGLPLPGVPGATVPRRRFLLLRWQTSPGVGLPTEPFKVWRRPATPLAMPHAVAFEDLGFPPFKIIQFDVPLAAVRITVHSNSGGNVLIALLVGPPLIESLAAAQTRTLAAGGSDTIEFQAPLITGLALFNVSSYDAPTGMTVDELDKVQGWQLVETVGLPVKESEWSGLGQHHGIKQGLVGAEVPAISAAVDRYKRGINPLGWWPTFPDTSAAPAWQLPDPAKLVDESSTELLPMLHDVAALAPSQQAAKLFSFTIPPPQNPAGDVMPATNPGKADLSPVGLLQMAASTDPLVAVVLGYGTGYADEDLPTINLGDRQLFGDPTRSDWDWLITGLWEKGLDGKSAGIEYAALVPRPGMGLAAPAPADFAVDLQAHLRPASADQAWITSIRASWERFPLTQLASVASFAAARRRNGMAGAATPLLQKHDIAGGHSPIGNARNERDPEPTRQSATDATLTIPNDPGTVAATYAAATQNIFGLWSPWVAGPITVDQPPLAPVQFLSADLRATDPGSGSSCPGTLVCEISVDWRVRRPKQVDLRGRLFAAATRSSNPPAAPAPAGIQKSLGGLAPAIAVTFAGDVPSLAGGTVVALNSEGTAVVTPGQAQQGTARRYRLTIPGFSLNYAATPHIGIVLEARMVERIAPNTIGPWPPVPRLAYASDPRAKPTTVDIVQLASLPDAAGECHVHVGWAGVTGAIGYALYESTETRILTSHPSEPQPTPDRTLSERLTTIKHAFRTNPIRRDFTRRNAELLTTTAADVTIPRGSRDIHVYTVLPVMPGGIEGPWPSGPTADAALIAYTAPKVASPAPPTIEVQAVADKLPAAPDHRARIRVGTRGASGAHPKRIDLYRVRVDDAARALDSMGPPIASLTASGGGWTVAQSPGGGWITTVTGDDRPTGSWRNVWYRAVAWSEDDLLRGVLKGRSAPSPAVSVLVPPAGPPNLSALTMSWPGGDPAGVLVSFTSTAPIPPTPVGPHLLSVEATPAGKAALVNRKVALDKVAGSQPANGSDVWRLAGSATQYRLIVRRSSINDAVTVIVRMADPLGRMTERTLAIPSGSIVPLPVLSPIVVAPLLPSGKAYGFTTDAPNTNAEGAFRLRIELTPVAPPPPSPPGPVLPRPQFRLIGGVYVFDGTLASVPTVAGKPSPGATGLAVMRQPSPTSDHFAIAATVALGKVVVTITTPDGRTVEQRARG
ncbi:MAG: hypothetical protein ABW203_05265 [Novosphingobium sp.]